MFDNQSALNHYDAIVIGSGISGLTTALILAKEGQKVAVMEKDRDIDPLIRPYRRKDCECSPGLHIVGWMDEGEVISSFFNYLNISDGVEKELHENGFGNIVAGDNIYHFPKGFDQLQAGLSTYFPEDAEAVAHYIRIVREVNTQTFFINHQMLPESQQAGKFGGLENYTLAECLKKYHASRELIELLGMFNYILMGSKADEVPFVVHAFVLGGFFQSPGSFTITGIKRLLANFKRELARFGVNLFLKTEVAEILVDQSRTATGVRIQNGECYYADNIIASFHPKLLDAKLKNKALRPIYRERLLEAENTFGLYVAFYKVDLDQAIEIENLIYYNNTLGIALGATINRSGVNRILSVFLAEETRDIPADQAVREIRAGEKLKLIEEVIAEKIPAFKDKIVLLDYLKPWSFERYTHTVNGSAYGIKQTSHAMGFQHKVPVHRLYLVGQSIYPGFLGSMVSGFSLALELLDSEAFWPKVTKEWN